MQTYQIIKDEKLLLDFINWLPDLQDNETYYCSLFARKKYSDQLIHSNDRTQLKRFTSSKERLFEKISQLELPLGRWKLKSIEAPQESLVVYINPNPRCQKKATELMGAKCWTLMKSQNYNIHAEALSCIQQSKSRTCYVDFDIDTKDVNLTKLSNIFPTIDGQKCYDILETRGGYHILVKPINAEQSILISNGKFGTYYDTNWYVKMKQFFNVDQVGDMLIPIPGCTQGGFIPKFVNI